MAVLPPDEAGFEGLVAVQALCDRRQQSRQVFDPRGGGLADVDDGGAELKDVDVGSPHFCDQAFAGLCVEVVVGVDEHQILAGRGERSVLPSL